MKISSNISLTKTRNESYQSRFLQAPPQRMKNKSNTIKVVSLRRLNPRTLEKWEEVNMSYENVKKKRAKKARVWGDVFLKAERILK